MKVKTLVTCILLTLTLCKHGVWAKVTNKELGWLKSTKNLARKVCKFTRSEDVFIYIKKWEDICNIKQN